MTNGSEPTDSSGESAALSPAQLEHYLRTRIPLARAMEVRVEQACADEVVLAAPLAPNSNHRGTLFGGSAAAIAILAAWALLKLRLQSNGIAATLVIQQNDMQYELPVSGAFRARSALASAESWERFLDTLRRRQRARITVTATLEQEGAVAARFSCRFVALVTGSDEA